MNVAELLVNIGIKGSDKTIGALGDVKKGLGSVASMSLEAKAGIIAAIYALERMMSGSFNTGAELTQLHTTLGVGTKELQEYEYAVGRVGGTLQDVGTTFTTIQTQMASAMKNKGVAESIGQIGKTLGHNFSREEILRLSNDQGQMILLIQQYMQKAAASGVPLAIAIQNANQVGMTGKMLEAAQRGQFTPENFKKAPIISEGDLKNLESGKVAISDLEKHIMVAFAHFNSIHGVQLIHDIDKIAKAIFNLTAQITILADKWKIFGVISEAMGGIADLATAVGGGNTATKGSALYDSKSILHMPKFVTDAQEELLKKNDMRYTISAQSRAHKAAELRKETMTINQTNNFVKDAQESSQHLKKALVNTVKGSPMVGSTKRQN